MRRSLPSPLALALALAAVIALSSWAFVRDARAADAEKRDPDEENVDPTHGRLAGDVSFVLGVGATVAPRTPRATLDVRARYLDVIGVFGTYEDALGAANAEPQRVIATGLEVRPLFLGRWLQGMHSGAATLDLMLDSFGLEIGAAFQKPQGASFGTRPALQTGLGFEVPLFAQAQGLWLGAHGGARFGDRALEASSVDSPVDRSLFVGLTLAFHAYVDVHLVDRKDRRVADRRAPPRGAHVPARQ